MISPYKEPQECRNYLTSSHYSLLTLHVWASIMLPESKPGEGKIPSAWNTIFGRAIFGQYIPKGTPSLTTKSSVNHTTMMENTDALLSRFWEIEEPSITRTALTPEELEVQSHFSKTHNFLSSGRYCVTLPQRSDTQPLGDSR